MTIKVKTGDIVAAVEPMAKLAKVDMPFATSLRVAKLLGQMGEVIQQFHTKRNALLRKLGTPIEGQESQFSFTPANGKEFAAQVEEANGVEVELLGELLVLPDDLVVSPEVVLGIQKFLQDQP